MTAEQWQRLWQLYEEEFKLSEHPFIERVHVKNRRLHKHRVYGRIHPITGRAAPDSWMRVRAEKVARIAEIEFGHEITIGRFHRAVKKALELERPEIAHILDGPEKPVCRQPVLGPDEMSQGERVGINPRSFRSLVFKAYCDACGKWPSFARTLDDAGITIAHGSRAILVVDEPTGYYASLRKILASEAKSRGRDFLFSNAEISQIFGNAKVLGVERRDGFHRELQRRENAIAFDADSFGVMTSPIMEEIENLERCEEPRREATLKDQRETIWTALQTNDDQLEHLNRFFQMAISMSKLKTRLCSRAAARNEKNREVVTSGYQIEEFAAAPPCSTTDQIMAPPGISDSEARKLSTGTIPADALSRTRAKARRLAAKDFELQKMEKGDEILAKSGFKLSGGRTAKSRAATPGLNHLNAAMPSRNGKHQGILGNHRRRRGVERD